MNDDNKPDLSRLSGVDRWAIRGAAFTSTLTSFAREDIEAHPARYPLYVACIGLFCVPVAGYAVVAATALSAWAGWPEPMARAERRLKDAFNEQSLANKYGPYVSADPARPEQLRVDRRGLVTDTACQAANDAWQSTRTACTRLSRCLFG